MRLLAALGGEQTLLPHFLRHYAALGVTHFHLAVREGTVLPDFPVPVSITTSYAGPHDMMQDCTALRALQVQHVADDEWFFVLDGDEFARPPFPLPEVLAEADARGCTWVVARVVDRVAADGSLPPVLPDSDLEALFPQRLLLTPLLLGGPLSKSVLVKGRTEITPGHHYCEGRVLDAAFEIDHYKWHAGVVERLRTRARLYRHVGYDWWVQSEAFLRHFEQHGKIDLTRFLAYI